MGRWIFFPTLLCTWIMSNHQISFNFFHVNPGPLSWISTGHGFSWGACKSEAIPMLWVNKGNYSFRSQVIHSECLLLPCLDFWWQTAFFNQHGCTTNAANAKYNSRAAQLYREKIKTLATQATRRHGTDVTSQTFIFKPVFLISNTFYLNLLHWLLLSSAAMARQSRSSISNHTWT